MYLPSRNLASVSLFATARLSPSLAPDACCGTAVALAEAFREQRPFSLRGNTGATEPQRRATVSRAPLGNEACVAAYIGMRQVPGVRASFRLHARLESALWRSALVLVAGRLSAKAERASSARRCDSDSASDSPVHGGGWHDRDSTKPSLRPTPKTELPPGRPPTNLN